MPAGVVTEGETWIVYPDNQKRFRDVMNATTIIATILGIDTFGLIGASGFLSVEPLRSEPTPSFTGLAVGFSLGAMIYGITFFSIMAIAVRQKDQPVVSVSPEGLTIYSVLLKIGPVRWNEIAEVRAIKFSRGYYIAVIPEDAKKLCCRLGNPAAWLICGGMQRISFPWLADLLLMPVYLMDSFPIRLDHLSNALLAPIIIPEKYLPMSADELAAQIRMYRLGRSAR
jgi:hypothetical protein